MRTDVRSPSRATAFAERPDNKQRMAAPLFRRAGNGGNARARFRANLV
jgi:hypothetical protein